jgi:chromosome segregation ATPase
METAVEPAKTSYQWEEEIEAIERELEDLAHRVDRCREDARSSGDENAIFAAVTSLEEAEKLIPVRKLQRWHAQKHHLLARKAEVTTQEREHGKSKASESAAQERDEAQRELDIAQVKLAQAERKFQTTTGYHRGLVLDLQRIEKALAEHEKQRPTI